MLGQEEMEFCLLVIGIHNFHRQRGVEPIDVLLWACELTKRPVCSGVEV